MIYGTLPADLGLIDLNPTEMMCWLYCPVKSKRLNYVQIPDNLLQFVAILKAVKDDNPQRFLSSYVYLTAKTLYVGGSNVGNRPGWHSDGFGTDDVNYIWYDRAPTEFLSGEFELPEGCDESMAEMTRRAEVDETHVYPNKHLLRLDQRVIHRAPEFVEPGMRTFIKVSVSNDKYDLIGNSINHEFAESWPLKEREPKRNHPATCQSLQATND